MNRNRLSTTLARPVQVNLENDILKLLASPSNYEIHPNGKIWVKSRGIYLKGRGNTGVKVLDDKGIVIYNFDSIKDCALFFGVSDRTINRRLDSASVVEFKGGQLLVFKREVPQP